MASLIDMLKGPSGTIEVARVAFASGSLSMVLAPLLFQGYALWKGQTWDAASFCGGYGGGLAAVFGLGGLGIATKDKGVASAAATKAANPDSGEA